MPKLSTGQTVNVIGILCYLMIIPAISQITLSGVSLAPDTQTVGTSSSYSLKFILKVRLTL